MIIEYDKTVTVAIDYDGTITNAHGEIKAGAIFWIKSLQKCGAKTILWTCRKEPILPTSINLQLPDQTRGDSQKLNADIYIDDRNPLGCQWIAAYIKTRMLIKKRKYTL